MEKNHYTSSIGNTRTACGAMIWGPDGRIKNSATNSMEATTCKRCKRSHSYRTGQHDRFRDEHVEYVPKAHSEIVKPIPFHPELFPKRNR